LTHRWIDSTAALQELVDDLAGEQEIALDTEFHRERTYHPQVALIQLVGREGPVALVDTLAVDPTPLAPLLTSALVVMHAAAQDLEVLARACGTTPAFLFDTQVAAGFAGYATPSLGTLVRGEVGVQLPKGDRLTDWLRRPLGTDQREYAAADVAHLLAVADRLRDRLRDLGRLEWAEDECAELLARSGPREPNEAWWRVKEARQLRGRSSGVAQSVAAWRERRASIVDQPVRFVLPDLALVGIAQRPPPDVDALRRVRGLDERHLRGGAAKEIMAAIEAGLRLREDEVRMPPAGDVTRELRPAVTLAGAWVSQLGRTLGIDPGLLATRSDVEALLRDDADARLLDGWRGEVVGSAIRRLVQGEVALAFGGDGHLVLEERSGRPA
jgi:ribonuclease D